MNLLLDYQNKINTCLHTLEKKKIIALSKNFNGITVELSPKNQDTDISSNAAMIIARFNKTSPVEIAKVLQENFLKNFKEFKDIKIAKPGFLNINFTLDFWLKHLNSINKLKSKFGSTNIKSKKYLVEFVSANPTGPLHVGHCRGAILGDTLSKLLLFNGHSVTKEYYVNDYGGQIKIFVLSVYYRILEIVDKKKFPQDENLYPGDYIIFIANEIIKSKKIKDYSNFEKIYNTLALEALNCSMNLIKGNLKTLRIKHDSFVFESKLIKNDWVNKTIEDLKTKNFVYSGKLDTPKGELTKDWKQRNQLLFKSTKFGDDTDRALMKVDNTWTYFAGDIAYHAQKVDRNFDFLINVLGADHAGYIKRITAAVTAISNNKINLICKVSQLVKLFKNEKPFKMSKRKGDYITVEDLIKEVGVDSVRFMMLNRSNDVELDFDFEKVTEKSKDNPVFYVQYAYARINSIFKTLNINLDDEIRISKDNLNLNVHEIKILKKIAEWPRCVEISLNKLEPHRIPYYLYDLSTLFHSYWNLGNDNKEFRFVNVNGKYNPPRLSLLKALSLVIENVISLLGVSTPRRM